MTVSALKLAKHLGISPTYVRKLTAQGVIQRDAAKRFDLEESRSRYMDHRQRREAARKPVSLQEALSGIDIEALLDMEATR